MNLPYFLFGFSLVVFLKCKNKLLTDSTYPIIRMGAIKKQKIIIKNDN